MIIAALTAAAILCVLIGTALFVTGAETQDLAPTILGAALLLSSVTAAFFAGRFSV